MKLLKNMRKVGTAFFCKPCISKTSEAKLKTMAIKSEMPTG